AFEPSRRDAAHRPRGCGRQHRSCGRRPAADPGSPSTRSGFDAGQTAAGGAQVRTVLVRALFLFCASTWPLAVANRQPPEQPASAEGSTVWSGVYSAAQAKRGEAGAERLCAKCHSADLTGVQDGPSLVGQDVLAAWSSLTLRDLFDRIRT